VKPNRWGFAGSPLIWGDLVILNAGTAGIALDRSTGRIAWSNGTNAAGYASPMRFASGGKESVLIFAAKHLVALDLPSGRELWRQFWETVGTPTTRTLGHGRYIFSSFNRGCACCPWSRQPGHLPTRCCTLPQPRRRGRYLYAFNGRPRRIRTSAASTSPPVNLNGRAKTRVRLLILADGKLIVLSDKGELQLKPRPPTNRWRAPRC
jgi:hypothetical protein